MNTSHTPADCEVAFHHEFCSGCADCQGVTCEHIPDWSSIPLSEQRKLRCQADYDFRDMDGSWSHGICGDVADAVISITYRSAAYAEWVEQPQHVLEGICAAHLSELLHDHDCADACAMEAAYDAMVPEVEQIDVRVEAVL